MAWTGDALVDTIAMLDATGGWTGYGIRSLEHWVQWKANMSEPRAAKLVRVARRRGELPACWALFADGRLTEEAMVRIAQRVPAERDREMAATAPGRRTPPSVDLEPTPPRHA